METMTKTDRVHTAGMEAYETRNDVFEAVYTAMKAEGVRAIFAAPVAAEYQFMINKGYWDKSGPRPAREILATWFGE